MSTRLHLLRSRSMGTLAITMLVVGLAWSVGLGMVSASASQQEYRGGDGCFYTWNGTSYTLRRCLQGDGSDYRYAPDGRGGWSYIGQCLQSNGVLVCLTASGEYIELYSDGSSYVQYQDRTYMIVHPDGTIAERGFYNAEGEQNSQVGLSMRGSQALKSRSLAYQNAQNMSLQQIRRMNPEFFDSLFTVSGNVGEFGTCLWLHDSSEDLDGDRRTGFYELEEYCKEQTSS